MTLFSYSLRINSGNFQRKPASTIKSGCDDFKIFRTSLDFVNAILLNDKALTFSLLQRSSTLARGLLVST